MTEMVRVDINLVKPGDHVFELAGDTDGYFLKEVRRIVDYNLGLIETYELGIDKVKIEKCDGLLCYREYREDGSIVC